MLIDHIRELKTSQDAGDSDHNNEIISVIEELQEAEIIQEDPNILIDWL